MLLMVSHSGIWAQENLIINGGFEDGTTGWENLWTRTPYAGIASLTSHPVHSGQYAMQVIHWGEQDWSLGVSKIYPVKSGHYYEYSAWIQIDSLSDWADLSIIAYDSSKAVIDWNYSYTELAVTSQEYRLATTRFIIPDHVRYILPRFIGGGYGYIYIDDVSLVLKDSIPSAEYVLENSTIQLLIKTPAFSMRFLDKTNSRIYQAESSGNLVVHSVDSASNQMIVHATFLSSDMPIDLHISLIQDAVKIQLQAQDDRVMEQALAFPGKIESRSDDYLIVPRGTGIIYPVNHAYPFWDYTMYGWKATMAMVGVTNLTQGYGFFSDDPWNSGIKFESTSQSDYLAPQLLHYPVKGRFGHNRTFYWIPIHQDGYVELCQRYRDHVRELGYIKTFTEKQTINPTMVKLLGAVDFWALSREFQTPEFIDSLLLFGIDRAIISIGGSWDLDHVSDGIITKINQKGLLSSRYDIFTDVWPPTHPENPGYRTDGYPEDVIIDQDGNLQKGWLAYLDDNTPFQGYYTCSATHPAYADKTLRNELPSYPFNCRFIDVELSSILYECYSTAHPTGRREDALYRKQALQVVKDQYQLVTGSEEAREWAFPMVDYGEGTMSIQPHSNAGYDWLTPVTATIDSLYYTQNLDPRYRIPLHGLVYHDSHVPTWYTGDGQSKVPDYWDDKDLWNVLYASMPLFMPPDTKYWDQYREKFLSSYHLISSVTRYCGFSAMLYHRFLTADRMVQQTEFEGGWVITANFSHQESYSWQGISLPPLGFWASDGKSMVFRIRSGSNILAVAHLPDRLFIQPYNYETTYYGIQSSTALFLQKESDGIHLAVIGPSATILIHEQKFIWPMKILSVINEDNNKEVVIRELTDHWKLLELKNQGRFFKLKAEFLTSIDTVMIMANQPGDFRASLYPHPIQNRSRIEFDLPHSGRWEINLYNLIGQKIRNLLDQPFSAGRHEMIFQVGDYSSGLYFLEFRQSEHGYYHKILIIR